MKQIFLFLILLIAACTSADRNKEWLRQTERHFSLGHTDSTLSCLYKVNEEKQALEKKLADKRLYLSNAGNIAEAALQINDCFRSAQNAAEQYLN
ncbi:MAG: hypothetical protein IIU51_06300, partial [Bacteroidaceae bacterium]|nr:hypothetical protein [Bacteroidaceae bacterium]